MPPRKIRYSFHRTLITGIHFHSSFYNKNLLFCLYRLFTSNARAIKQIRENSFTVITFKTRQCDNFRTKASLDTHVSCRCCIARVFHRIGHYRRKHNVVLSKFITNLTSINPIPGAIQNDHIENKLTMTEEFSLNEKILRDRVFHEKVRNDSLHYNILTENLYKIRHDPLKAYEIYTNVIKNGLLNYIKSHHVGIVLQNICYNPNKRTFEWLTQIMKDLHSFNLKNRIPFYVYKMTLYKMVDLSNDNNSLSEILDAIVEKNEKNEKDAFYGNIDAYRILMNIYCKRDVKEALYFLRRVILSGQIPRKGLYSKLIHELCKQGKLEEAEELLEEFEEYLDTPDIFLFTSLISGYSKRGEMDKIEKTFKRLLELGIQPDKKLYTTLIFTYLRHGDTHGAYKFYEEIIKHNIKHDNHLFASLIYMRANNSSSADAREIFEKMKSSGIIPNSEVYNHLLYAYNRDNSVNTTEIENLYLQMLSEGVKPNHYTFELLIDATCKRRNFLKASRFLNEMKRSNIPITNVALNSIIRHQTLSGHIDHAISLYKQMISVGIEPNLHVYTSIISLATVSSRHSLAIKVFKELLAKGYKPNVYVYSALITSFVKAKKPQMAIKTLQQMVRNNVSINHIPLTALIQSFAITKRFEDGKRLYEMMKKMNLKIDRFVYRHFEKLIKRARREDDLKHLHEDIKKRGLDPSSRDRIYTKGKGPSYWRIKFLSQRRILRKNIKELNTINTYYSNKFFL